MKEFTGCSGMIEAGRKFFRNLIIGFVIVIFIFLGTIKIADSFIEIKDFRVSKGCSENVKVNLS